MARKPLNPRSGSTPGPKTERLSTAVGDGGAVEPPELSTAARRLWQQLAPELEQSKLLTPRDAVTLGIACEVGAFAQQAAAMLHENGLTSTDAAHKDTERRSATWVVFQQAASTWLQYAAHLGLSPKARSALAAPQASAADAFEEYLRRGAAMRAQRTAEEW